MVLEVSETLATGNNGNAGGTSSFGSYCSLPIMSFGGGGGEHGNVGAGAPSGGTGTGGNINIDGSAGGNGWDNFTSVSNTYARGFGFGGTVLFGEVVDMVHQRILHIMHNLVRGMVLVVVLHTQDMVVLLVLVNGVVYIEEYA